MTTFLIEFDILAGHNPGTGATLDSSVLKLTGWRSIGDPGGARIINRTGGVIRAIYLAINGPTNAFQVTSASGGRLFNTIWVKPGPETASEAYFMDGNVLDLGAFWMRVPRNTCQEIQRCDSGEGCPFMGKVFAQNPPPPAGPKWKKLRSPPSPRMPHWEALIAATPSDYRQIDAYGETPDRQIVLFLSHGELLHYDNRTKIVSLAKPLKVGTLPLVNAIVFDAEKRAFKLFHNGTVVSQVDAEPREMIELGRAF